ncbi:hypothetical protein [Burkholderia sp.]|uniref:hypothetical protein n=1 Tax=Burkholderia sp. TaxID=36773 RepID=UPI0025B8824E|nr:hypothetical protein [Burkholderia sp.]
MSGSFTVKSLPPPLPEIEHVWPEISPASEMVPSAACTAGNAQMPAVSKAARSARDNCFDEN